MRAAFIRKTGAPQVIEIGDLPQRSPEPTEVVIKNAAASVNPIDTYIRSGTIGMASQFPYVPGCDFAGTVTAVGEQVQRFQPGDRVWGSNQSLFGRQGTMAEFVITDEDWVYPTPDDESDAEAAAGALVGITAHLGLFLHGGLQAGETVFVNGGTGGVGSSVVQLAKGAGARVICTAGSEEKRNYARKLGADLALDYKSSTIDDDIKQFAAETDGVQLWFETQREPMFERTVPLMAKRGRIILMAGRDARPAFPVGPFYVNDLRMAGFAMFNASPGEQRACADDLNRKFVDGTWRPQIGKRLPLDASAEAHQLQEDNTLGKQGTLSGKIVIEIE